MPSLILNITCRHVSLSQKGYCRADNSTEKVKKAQRCGVAAAIKYRSGGWKEVDEGRSGTVMAQKSCIGIDYSFPLPA